MNSNISSENQGMEYRQDNLDKVVVVNLVLINLVLINLVSTSRVIDSIL